MYRDPSSIDRLIPKKDRRDISDMIQRSFGLPSRWLTGLELESVRSGFVLPCPVQKSIGCNKVPCTPRTLGLDGHHQATTCLEGLTFGFAPVEHHGIEVAYIQVGPFFPSVRDRERLLFNRPELTAAVDDYPIIPEPEDGMIRMISSWIGDHLARRLNEEQLAHNEALLLSVVDSTKHIAGITDPQELLSYFAEITTYLTNASSAFILALDPSREFLKIRAASGVGQDFDRSYQVRRGEGVTWSVIEDGEFIYVPDVEKDSRYLAVGYKAASELAVPITSGERVIGVLVADSMRINAFSPFHVSALEGLASQVGVVLETLDHRLDSVTRLRQLSALHRVSEAVNGILNQTRVLERVLEAMEDVFDVSSCSVMLADGDVGQMILKTCGQDGVREFGNIDLNSERGILGYVVQSRQPLLIRPDSGALFERFRDFISTDIASLMCVPLMVENRFLGTLVVAGSNHACFDSPELDLLCTIARVVSQAIERSRLYEQSQRQIAELSLMNEMGKAVNSSLDLDQVLDYAVNMISSILDAASGSIMLLDPQSESLRIVASKNMDAQASSVELQVGEGVAGWVAANRKPLILRDAQRDPRYSDNRGVREPFSMISAPIADKQKILGVMNFERPLSKSTPFSEDDLKPVMTLASQAASAISNASLYRDLIQVHFETIQTLASALEAKDPYTHGHSRRVSKDAVRIAQRLKLDSKQIEEIRHAALLHDIGKIGVKDAVLLKPGPLTDLEFSHIKRHAALGAGILSPVEHLRGVSTIVRHHHERVDGRGYPQNLKGEDIPLGSRIICISDSFDAMITTRPYREGMPLLEAVEQLVLGKNTQFDSGLVDIFVEIIKEQHPSLVADMIRVPCRIERPGVVV